MSEEENFHATVDAVYAASTAPELWHDALRSIARLFGGVATTMEVFNKRPMGLAEFRVAGLPPRAETAYLEHYAKHNPRADYALSHLGEAVLWDAKVIDERAMDRTPYYAKYLKSIGLRYFISGQIANNRDIQAVIAVQRSPRQGHVGRRHIALMRRLIPHVHRAFDVDMRLRAAAHDGQALEQTLDWLLDGVVLLSADGTVAYANDAIRIFAAANDGVRLSKTTIEFGTVEARARLQSALGVVVRPHDGQADSRAVSDFPIPRPSGAPPYLVSVRPLRAAGRMHGRSDNAVAAVFIRDPVATRPAEISALRQAYGLTEAEADLARAVQAGISPPSYAQARAVSLNTIYTHLRRIKEKTGTKRTAELMLKLNGVRIPLVSPTDRFSDGSG
jgi:DNA-binding CsgD family transcriptional regulator